MKLQVPEILFKDLSEQEQNETIDILEEFCITFLTHKQFPTTLDRGVEIMLPFLDSGVLKLQKNEQGNVRLLIFDFKEDRYKCILNYANN